MTVCYVCEIPHEITERLAIKTGGYDVCLDCLRKVRRAADELDLSTSMAIHVTKYFYDEKKNQ